MGEGEERVVKVELGGAVGHVLVVGGLRAAVAQEHVVQPIRDRMVSSTA